MTSNMLHQIFKMLTSSRGIVVSVILERPGDQSPGVQKQLHRKTSGIRGESVPYRIRRIPRTLSKSRSKDTIVRIPRRAMTATLAQSATERLPP